jgi:hypothetical protein
MTSYKKRTADIKHVRYGTDPAQSPRAFMGDSRFWLPHQADWYESVIMPMTHRTTPMRYIDWQHLLSFPAPIREVAQEVYNECKKKRLADLMAMKQDWNDEVIAQFYATLYIHQQSKTLYWALGGRRFSITLVAFAGFLGLPPEDVTDFDLHSEAIPHENHLSFMYDDRFGKIEYGKTHGLQPYFRLMNQLFRFTLTPRIGDSYNISYRAKNILSRMNPPDSTFSVSKFIWNEIISCSYDGTSSCHYAPYIFRMILGVTGLGLLTNQTHIAYKSNKGQLERMLHIGSRARSPQRARGVRIRGASSSRPPLTRDEEEEDDEEGSPSGPPSTKKKTSTLKFLSKALFACFKGNQKLADELHQQKIESVRQANRQKKMMRHFGIEASSDEDEDIPPPVRLYNPWYEASHSQEAGPSGEATHVFGPGVQGEGEGGNQEEGENESSSDSEETSFEEPSDPFPVAKGKGKAVEASDSDYDGDE